nr:hypothetical protein Iba_chr14bCG4610 [Ipomoea batatas]
MDSTAKTLSHTIPAIPKCLQNSGLHGTQNLEVLFLEDLQKTPLLQLQGSSKIMARSSTITCTMEGQILAGLLVGLLQLAMTMMPR